MNTLKIKLFGDNAMNFWGWLLAGLLVIVASAGFVVLAKKTGIYSTTDLLLTGIYLVLCGHFGLALTNYLARVSEKLDAKK